MAVKIIEQNHLYGKILDIYLENVWFRKLDLKKVYDDHIKEIDSTIDYRSFCEWSKQIKDDFENIYKEYKRRETKFDTLKKIDEKKEIMAEDIVDIFMVFLKGMKDNLDDPAYIKKLNPSQISALFKVINDEQDKAKNFALKVREQYHKETVIGTLLKRVIEGSIGKSDLILLEDQTVNKILKENSEGVYGLR